MIPVALLVVFLLCAGAALLAIEVLVLPGFGLIGILGGLAMLAALLLAWTQLGWAYGLLVCGIGIALTAFMFWLFPRTGLARAMVLSERQKGTRASDVRLGELVGQTGIALTPLKPSGTCEFMQRHVDVVTNGVYIEAGTMVRVVHVEGSRVIVEIEE